MELKGVILDIDGTLLDSNEAHAEAWERVLAQEGYYRSRLEIRRLIGMGSDKLLRHLVGSEIEQAQVTRLSETKKRLFLMEFAARVRPWPGANELLVRLRDDGFKLAVASSSSGDELDRNLQILDPRRDLGLIVGRALEAAKVSSKPESGLVELALSHLGIAASQAVMLGDTPYDLLASHRAGARFVGFLCGGWRAEDLKEAVALYQGPKDLLDRYEESLFRGISGQLSEVGRMRGRPDSISDGDSVSSDVMQTPDREAKNSA